MSNQIAALLTIVVVSPSIIVLAVLIGRRIRDYWPFSLSHGRKEGPCHGQTHSRCPSGG